MVEGRITFTEKWPVIITTMPKEVSDEALDAALNQILEYLRRGEPFALVSLRGEGGLPTPLQRKRMIAFFSKYRADFRRSLRAWALVEENPRIRGFAHGVVTAISWFIETPATMKWFEDGYRAELWARAMV